MKIGKKVKRFLKKNYPFILSVNFKDKEGNHRFSIEGDMICADMDVEIPFKRPHSSLFYKFLKVEPKLNKKNNA